MDQIVKAGGQMRGISLGGVALAILVTASPAMAVKAPKRAPPIVPVYNWTGLYVGGNAGWGFASANGTSGLLNPDPLEHGGGSSSLSWNGFIGGGQIGYNWMVSRNIVLGIEADLSGTTLKGNGVGVSADGTSYKTFSINPVGTVRGRIGYASDNWLFYGTGGGAYEHAYLTNTQGPCGHGDPACLPPSPVPLGAMDSDALNLFGWTAGAGVEVGITSNWTAKLEYLYMYFPSFNYANPVFNRVTNATENLSIVRLGVNYKFN